MTHLILRLRSFSGVTAVVLTVTVFHAITYYYVRAFYAANLPHYDSIGAYTFMFEIMNLYDSGALTVALAKASGFFLSWLQAFFALIGAPLLNKTPESLQALNSLTLVAFMLSIYAAARAYGAGRLKAYLLSLPVLLPDALDDWWGGSVDMRRDFAYLALLGSTFFSFFALAWRPSPSKSLWLGIVAGLTVISRDNAIFFLIAIIGPPFVIWIVLGAVRKAPVYMRLWVPGLVGAGVLVLPWLWLCLPLTLARRLDPFAMYGAGGDPWLSFRAYWSFPFKLMFGRLGDPSLVDDAMRTPLIDVARHLGSTVVTPLLGHLGGGIHGTFLLTSSFILFAGLLVVAMQDRLCWHDALTSWDSRSLSLFAAGCWALIATYILICFFVRLKPLDYSSGQIPFFPSLLLFWATAFVLGIRIRFHKAKVLGRRTRGVVLTVLFAAGLLALNVLRLEAKAPEPTARFVAIAKQLTQLLVGEGDQRVVAFFWHELISLDTIKYYTAQQGVTENIVKFRYTLDGHLLDLEVGRPDDMDPQRMVDSLARQVKKHADIVVVNARPGAYAIARHPLFVYEYAQPIVDALLKDPSYQEIFRFELQKEPIVVLKKHWSSALPREVVTAHTDPLHAMS